MDDLKETVEMMTSPDYKERLKAEWLQTYIRYKKLSVMVEKFKAGTLGFRPDCPLILLTSQLQIMDIYLQVLEDRAYIEKIDLPFEKNESGAAA